MHPDCSGRYVNTAICRHHARKQREKDDSRYPGACDSRGDTAQTISVVGML